MNYISENTTEMDRGFSFKKEERLSSKKVIDRLFSEGDSFLTFPIKVVFLEIPNYSKSPLQAAFSVGKRNFKLAVHRNQIKRKIREAYRLNKHILYKELGEKQLAIFFIFIGKTIPDFKLIEKAMKKAMEKLIKEIKSNKKTNHQ
jgi:ribonuclease P protein component